MHYTYYTLYHDDPNNLVGDWTGLDPLLSYSRAFDVPLEGKSIATSRWANFLKIEPELKKKIAVFLLLA